MIRPSALLFAIVTGFVTIAGCGGGTEGSRSDDVTPPADEMARYEELVALHMNGSVRVTFNTGGDDKTIWIRDGARWRIDDIEFHDDDIMLGKSFIDDGVTGGGTCIWSVNTTRRNGRTLCEPGIGGGFLGDEFLKIFPPVDGVVFTGVATHAGYRGECFHVVSLFETAFSEACFSPEGFLLYGKVDVHGREFTFKAELVEVAPQGVSFDSLIEQSRWEEVKGVDLPLSEFRYPDAPAVHEFLAEHGIEESP